MPPTPPLFATTRRHFLGKCLGGLALASATRLSAQTPLYGGVRLLPSKVCVADHYTLFISILFANQPLVSARLKGGPASPDCNILNTEAPNPISVAGGTWSMNFLSMKMGSAYGTTPELIVNDVKVSQSYPVRLVSKTEGTIFSAMVVTDTVTHSKGYPVLRFKINPLAP